MKKSQLKEGFSKVKQDVILASKKMENYLLKEKPAEKSSAEDKDAIITPLNQVQKQIDDIKAMIEVDENYYDITKQIESTRRALYTAERQLSESRSVPLQ